MEGKVKKDRKFICIVQDIDSFIQVEESGSGARLVFHDWGSRSCATTLLTRDEFERLSILLARAVLAAEERDRKEIKRNREQLHSLIDEVIERYLRS